MRTRIALLALLASATTFAAGLPAAAAPPTLSDDQRAFFFEGAGWLLPDDERDVELAKDEAARAEFIANFAERAGVSREDWEGALARRHHLARSEFLSPLDIRYRLLFVNGPPTERLIVDCGQVFVPLEIWSWRPPGAKEDDDREAVVVYQSGPGLPWRLWLPFDGKRPLYLDDMGYLMDQWYEGNGRLFRAQRFDLQLCQKTYRVDFVTGVRGTRDPQPNRPSAAHYRRFLTPQKGIATWVQQALSSPLPEFQPLPIEGLVVQFPRRQNQRIVTRFTVNVPPEANLQATAATSDGSEPGPLEHRLVIQGVIEQGGRIFENFRVRFLSPAPETPVRRALVTERSLRPGERFVVRMEIKDEISGARAFLDRGFLVPVSPEAVVDPPVPEEAMVALEDNLEAKRVPGADSLLLVPPTDDVILSVWRAQALVSGERIVKVAFAVDGKTQLTDTALPFEAEIRLAQFPVEQVIRAEGYDAAGELVAADEVIINQPRGAFRVRITEPRRGKKVTGEVLATAEVIVPPERRIESVSFEVDGKTIETLAKPPWQAKIQVPSVGDFSYLAVRAQLDDGLTAEDTRILRAPEGGLQDEVEVELVEIYAAVTDRQNRPVRDLTQQAFRITEAGKTHTIQRFERVENLPLTVGVALDTSGSMSESIAEAQKAAKNFLTSVLKPQDRSFAVAFSTEPSLLMAPTDDAEAVVQAIERTKAYGNTALYDAVVTALYYFRGVPGQRALVVLSDGADTNSSFAYREALEFARRSGVAIYTIALKVSRLDTGARSKLTELAEETGGRSFFVNDAAELSQVYGEIEQELRTRYFLAFSPDLPDDTPAGYRPIEVSVEGAYKVRAARGYYR